MAALTWSRLIPMFASFPGSAWTRTAYFCEPRMSTCATPLTMEMRWAIRFSPYSATSLIGSVDEVRAKVRIGWSAGLTLRYEGGERMSFGSSRWATDMADWTSSAAASMSLSRANWSVMRVEPRPLVEVIESIPEMVENSFSSGRATADAMVSGLAPGRFALTWIVGKSTVGRSFTGSIL